ncbi:GrpB family protein [Rickettsiella endosymbiont of Dermanyssus gallinae]|uniref:GrpB family protein n=1 Tax=Rickettsiella endosymbiont of Dermanyssus gallinae TaxID=2856608 RepID=UPI001C52E1EE|nr:GrpB family protein [Rickettsiella endosymbiont of Dermanyssus gallinae]
MIDPNEKIRFVELTEYNPEWPRIFSDAAKDIKSILKENCVQIHHIGSTAIPNIYAKPIIDMLPVVKDISLVDSLNHEFENLGYVCMGEYGNPGRRFYWKSKTKRTHNIHLFEQGASEIRRHLLFRDFMIAHKDYAQAYSLLKQSLADVFSEDIENYVNGKSSFIQMIDYKTGSAKAEQLDAKDNIIIEPYHSNWPKLAEAEIKAIKGISSQLSYVSIEHLGSTAVPGLASKPVIDIFIAVKSIEEAKQWIKPLETLAYVFWAENPSKSHLRFFKGMPPFGSKRTHHVHIIENSSGKMEHRILFRDILRRDQKIRLEYEALKMKLSGAHSADREAYTDKKGAFIKKVLREQGYLKSISR